MALAEKQAAALTKKLDEIERAEPAKPRWFSLPGAKDRYKKELAEWTKERDSLVAALNRTRQRGAKAREFTAQAVAGHRSPGERLAKQKAERRHPELAKAIQAGQEQRKREQVAAIQQKLDQQRQRSRERGGRGH